MKKKIKFIGWVLILTLLTSFALPMERGYAADSVVILLPASFSTQKGSASGNVVNMYVRDGASIFFSTPSSIYRGIHTFYLQKDVDAQTITSLQIKVKVKLTTPAIQRWQWRLYDWQARSWIKAGDTVSVQTSTWKSLIFSISNSPARFVGTDGAIRMSFASTNSTGNARIDYESITVTYNPLGTGTCGETTNSNFESQVLTLINQQRANAGVPALKRDTRLDTASRLHSADMACNDYFAHNSLDGRTPWDRMHAQGYTYHMAAENIAAGYSTPAAVVTGWMNSPGHRDNILNSGLTQIGIGHVYYAGSTYGHYWTTDFGTP